MSLPTTLVLGQCPRPDSPCFFNSRPIDGLTDHRCMYVKVFRLVGKEGGADAKRRVLLVSSLSRSIVIPTSLSSPPSSSSSLISSWSFHEWSSLNIVVTIKNFTYYFHDRSKKNNRYPLRLDSHSFTFYSTTLVPPDKNVYVNNNSSPHYDHASDPTKNGPEHWACLFGAWSSHVLVLCDVVDVLPSFLPRRGSPSACSSFLHPTRPRVSILLPSFIFLSCVPIPPFPFFQCKT